jgi:MFS family permease
VERSLLAVLVGTFTLRFSTGLTGALLGFYLAHLANLPATERGGEVTPLVVGAFAALFYLAELVLSPFFGILSDRWGHHRVMQFGPAFGGVAVLITAFTTNLPLLGGTRVLEGASTAASVPSILGYLAMATAFDEVLKGRAVARFEAATLAGLGIGIATAGIFWQLLGPGAFLVNAVIYGGSFLIYRFGVAEPTPTEFAATPAEARHYGLARYWELLQTSHVWLLAPTWIAVNASIGVWFSQSIFQFARADPRFPDQALLRGFSTLQITLAATLIFAIFTAGLFFWGRRFAAMRRTTIIAYGIVGGAGLVAATIVVNHTAGTPVAITIAFALLAAVGLFVLAGATPAALGLLTDISDGYPTDRGAIMGLYSVFLALGQISGSVIGGVAAELRGIDGLLVATLVLLGVALVPLYRLRAYEHYVGGPATAAVLYPEEGPVD